MGLKYPERHSEDVIFRDTFINEDYLSDNDGTITGDLTIDNGVEIDGQVEYITYPTEFNGQELTVVSNLDVDFRSGYYQTLLSNRNATGTYFEVGFNNAASTTDKYMYFYDGSTIFLSTATVPSTTKQVAYAKDSSDDIVFYADGVKVGDTVAGSALTNPNPIIYIGNTFTGSQQYINGTLYNVSVYNKSLSADEILDVYQADTFREIDASKAAIALPLRSSYDDGSNIVTKNIGTGVNAIMGDGSDPLTFPEILDPKGFYFDGSDYINLGSDIDFNYDEPQSFATMFKTGNGLIQALWSKSETGAGFKGYSVYMSAVGELFFRIYYAGVATGIRVKTSNTFLDDKLRHLAVTYDGSGVAAGVKIYIDEVEESLATEVNAGFAGDTTNSEDLNLGRASYNAIPYTGYMYEPEQYPFELTPTQVKELKDRAFLNLNV